MPGLSPSATVGLAYGLGDLYEDLRKEVNLNYSEIYLRSPVPALCYWSMIRLTDSTENRAMTNHIRCSQGQA